MEYCSPVVQQDLCPGDEAESHKYLRLHLKGDVEVLGNRVHAEWKAAWGV